MKTRYRLIRRGLRGGKFYCVDRLTGKRESLSTSEEDHAQRLLAARNERDRQPLINLDLAKVYLRATDADLPTRTWGDAIQGLILEKDGPNQKRWKSVAKDKALRPLWSEVIVNTKAADLVRIAKAGSVSTKVFLRRIHNFCVRRNYLPWQLVTKDEWPKITYKEKRSITWDEHCRIVAREKNPERKAFYQLAWYLGASQSDLAYLEANNIDRKNRTISYVRMKTRHLNPRPARLRFGKEVEQILAGLPKKGPLFPYLRGVREADRATEFRQRCQGLRIDGITLHSYRYAWAERAMACA